MRKRLFQLWSIIALCLFSASMSAQDLITVAGKVTEKQNSEPIPGVSIMLRGTTQGTITDFDGNYKIKVPSDAVLAFSFVGMKTQEVKVNGQNIINVSLESESLDVDEVVVIGYGTAKKRDLTGSIVSVSGDDLKTVPSANAVSGLQGKVAGVSITSSGVAGSSPNIKIRGIGTQNAGTNPLYVVDGVFTNSIGFLNPSDIESMEVLKDASSLAIFGVKGANGVVIITTKSAKKGEVQASYEGYAGVQMVHERDRMELTNASEFELLYNEALKNDDPNAQAWIPDLRGEGTDWQDQVLREGIITSHNITVSKGGEKGSSLFSAGYFEQEGVVKYDSYSRFNARLKNDYQLNDHIKVGSNVILTRWDRDNFDNNALFRSAKALPTYAPYDGDPVDPNNDGAIFTRPPVIQPNVGNPLAVVELDKGTSDSHGYRILASAFVEVNFLKDFKWKSTGYADISFSGSRNYDKWYTVGGSQESKKNSMSRTKSEGKVLMADHILNYSKKIDKHSVTGLLGMTVEDNLSESLTGSRDSIATFGNVQNPPEDLWMISAGHKATSYASDGYGRQKFVSYLARGTYAYDNKYLLNVSVRRDGSSKFGPEHRWGNFFSVGAGWVMSEESFIQDLDFIDFLKLKGSYGELGNDKIPNYAYYSTINPRGKEVVLDGQVIYIPTQNGIPDLSIHWERVKELDLGFEARMLDQRLSIDAGYFHKKSDELLNRPSPNSPVGPGYIFTNNGGMLNEGLELMLGWHNRIGDFQYSISGNVTYLHNEVTSVNTKNSADEVINNYYRLSVGQKIGAMYGYIHDGIFQNQQEIDDYAEMSWNAQPGDVKFRDLNGDEVIDENDRTYLGSHVPDWTYGLNLSASYKGFDLSVEMNGVAGNEIFNTKKMPGFAIFNYSEEVLNRWHGEGTSNWEPILSFERPDNYRPSTYMVEKGDYLRIRNIQFGYTLPKDVVKSIGVSSLRFYVNAQNPITFTDYSGYTPEVGGNFRTGGFDEGRLYPLPATYTAGLTLNF